MIKLSDYGPGVIKLASSCGANRVYPLSVAEGIQSGDIYADDPSGIKSLLIWHYCGFAYICEQASEEFLREVIGVHRADPARRMILITDDEKVARYYEGMGASVKIRYEYVHDHGQTVPAARTDVRTVPVDEGNIGLLKGHIIPSFSWDSSSSFLANGFGVVSLDGEEPTGVAFTSAVSSHEADIGVEVCENYRGRGLATVLALKMCDEILSRGLVPVWAHLSVNEGSMRTALKCGFKKIAENYVIDMAEVF